MTVDEKKVVKEGYVKVPFDYIRERQYLSLYSQIQEFNKKEISFKVFCEYHSLKKTRFYVLSKDKIRSWIVIFSLDKLPIKIYELTQTMWEDLDDLDEIMEKYFKVSLNNCSYSSLNIKPKFKIE